MRKRGGRSEPLGIKAPMAIQQGSRPGLGQPFDLDQAAKPHLCEYFQDTPDLNLG